MIVVKTVKAADNVTRGAPLRLPCVAFLMILTLISASLSMGDARAASLLQQAAFAQEHCAMAEMAGKETPHLSHPASKGMTCAMTCACIISAEPRFNARRLLHSQKQESGLAAPLTGIVHHLDLPPPKS